MHDSMGQFKRGFTANLRICPITIPEIWGAYYSLHMAWQHGHKQVTLELDFSAAVSLIQQGSDQEHLYSMVITRV